MNIYYIYAYLRSKDSKTARAGTPYYIGKGKGNRAWAKHRVSAGGNPIILLDTNLTEIGALALERRLIRWYGRQDLVTGILQNMTDGGDGTSGRIVIISDEHKEKLRKPKQWTEEGMTRLKMARNSRPAWNKGLTMPNDDKYKGGKKNKGRKQSEETVSKRSKSLTGLMTGEKNPMFGKKHSAEALAKCVHLGEANGMYGKHIKQSADTISKRSAANTGQKRPRVSRIVDRKEMALNTFNRWVNSQTTDSY